MQPTNTLLGDDDALPAYAGPPIDPDAARYLACGLAIVVFIVAFWRAAHALAPSLRREATERRAERLARDAALAALPPLLRCGERVELIDVCRPRGGKVLAASADVGGAHRAATVTVMRPELWTGSVLRVDSETRYVHGVKREVPKGYVISWDDGRETREDAESVRRRL